MTPSPAPRLTRRLRREANRLAAERARAEVRDIWQRHQRALHAEVAEMLLAGRNEREVLAEMQAGSL